MVGPIAVGILVADHKAVGDAIGRVVVNINKIMRGVDGSHERVSGIYPGAGLPYSVKN